MEHPQCLDDDRVRASLTDHALAAMVRFDNSPADVDATTRSARAGRRVAVRLARDFIHSRLSEPLRLSELCRHANLKIRSLEYGFREVTGLTPVAYIRSLRLNAVRRALQQQDVGAAALDLGDRHGRRFLAPQPVCGGLSPVLWRDADGDTASLSNRATCDFSGTGQLPHVGSDCRSHDCHLQEQGGRTCCAATWFYLTLP